MDEIPRTFVNYCIRIYNLLLQSVVVINYWKMKIDMTIFYQSKVHKMSI